MQRHRDGETNDLARNTVIWIAVVIWLAWGYLLQTPPPSAYEDGVRNIFTLVLTVLIPVVSAAFVIAWITLMQNRPTNQRAEPTRDGTEEKEGRGTNSE